MNYKNFETEIKDEILFVYFDSPGKSVNTFDRSSMGELNDILENIINIKNVYKLLDIPQYELIDNLLEKCLKKDYLNALKHFHNLKVRNLFLLK